MRFHVLDGWRGVCALLVAIFHINALGHFYGVPLIRHGLLFVDFFFVLSGFVITHAYAERVSAGGVRDFIIRRIGRLWPLHLALLVALIGVEFVKLALEMQGISYGRGVFTRDAEPWAIVTNVLMIHGWGIHPYLTWNNPSWSISAEWAAYLAFAAVYALAPRRAGVFAVLLGLVSLVLLIFAAPERMASTFDFGLARCGLGFCLGHLTYRFWKASAPPPWPTLVEFAALGAAVVVVSLASPLTWGVVAPFVFAAAVYVFAWQGGWVSKWMSGIVGRKLGEWSYSIYMVQGLVAVVVMPGIILMWPRLGWGEAAVMIEGKRLLAFGSPWAMDLFALGYIALVVAVASQTYRWIETPGREVFARLAARASTPRRVAVAE